MRILNENDYETAILSLKKKGLIKFWNEDEKVLQLTKKGISEIGKFHNKNSEFFVLLSIYFYQENIIK